MIPGEEDFECVAGYSRQLKLEKVICALRFSWLILRVLTSSSAWSSRRLPALRFRCGWVSSSADAMRTASAPCLQSQNREAKASVARAEARRAVDGHFCCLSPLFALRRSTLVGAARAPRNRKKRDERERPVCDVYEALLDADHDSGRINGPHLPRFRVNAIANFN